MRTHMFHVVYRLIRVLEALFPSRNRIPVIMYHRVADDDEPLTISTENFRKQMQFLHDEGYQAITLPELEQALRKKHMPHVKSVAITFDDGYKDNLTNAKPIMDSYGFRGNVFVITNAIGGQRAFSYGSPAGYPMLSREDIQTLERAGWSMANHTHTHKQLTTLSREDIIAEVSRARDILDDILADSSTTYYIATPHDKADERVVSTLEEAGMRVAFAGKGIVHKKMHPRHLVRTEVPDTSSRAEFLAYLSPWYYRFVSAFFLLKKFGLFRQRN